MRRREVLAGAVAVAALGAAEPTFADTPSPTVRIALTTGHGTMVLGLFGKEAPLTCAGFLRYIDGKFYDGATFYRALRSPGAPQFGLIQGGARNDPAARALAPIAHEPTTQTGLRHRDGTLSLARRAPGTATSDFFICLGDAAYLDADPRASGDNLGFAAFGQVLDGMDIARVILALPTSPTNGAPEMTGQMLDPPVPIVSARRLA